MVTTRRYVDASQRSIALCGRRRSAQVVKSRRTAGVARSRAALSRRRRGVMMPRDEFRRDPLQRVGGKAFEQFPGEVEGLLDRAPLHALSDEAPLEVIDEAEDCAVVVGEGLLADDRG